MALRSSSARLFATASSPLSGNHHKVVVVGAGAAGLSVANMLYNRFADAGKTLADGDVAIVDGSKLHHYQPGWTLVGSGLAQKQDLAKPVSSLIPSYIHHHAHHASTFSPSTNSVTLASGGPTLTYDYLVVCPGLQTNFKAVAGLEDALSVGTKESKVGSIYGYEYCDQVWDSIESFDGKKAIFTQPKGIIKCAGAPQKVMWMARSQWARQGKNVDVNFISGMPTMFAVPKYSQALVKLAEERGVNVSNNLDLVSLSHTNRTATFKNADGESVTKDFDFLHVVPPQGPLDTLKNSPLTDVSGYVTVSSSSLQHTEFPNVFALGDASSLPTSKTEAAITSQTPVVVENLLAEMEGKKGLAVYGGYTSCPLLTGHNELLLAEFKYGGIPDETFAKFGIDQAKPNKLFYHLKKDIFPYSHYNFMVKGKWFGRSGLFAPRFDAPVEKQ
ncbi:Sulfide:quinone oxidoreductase/flavo-binding protein [Phaffia rhodozyma]|uniref:Sulfide:quinone oxidoreductase, mitochondrial n=1 Tax=Phaffia rhodozyma TaxID=264483 RepID=A0A0F7SFF2_PHARH|nr:Sulfide:quinone oxidoreductase/flavo-binding protein [Phaffia rhodozyma]